MIKIFTIHVVNYYCGQIQPVTHGFNSRQASEASLPPRRANKQRKWLWP